MAWTGRTTKRVAGPIVSRYFYTQTAVTTNYSILSDDALWNKADSVGRYETFRSQLTDSNQPLETFRSQSADSNGYIEAISYQNSDSVGRLETTISKLVDSAIMAEDLFGRSVDSTGRAEWLSLLPRINSDSLLRLEALASNAKDSSKLLENLFRNSADSKNLGEFNGVVIIRTADSKGLIEFLGSQNADIDNSAILVTENGTPVVDQNGNYILLTSTLGGFAEFTYKENIDSLFQTENVGAIIRSAFAAELAESLKGQRNDSKALASVIYNISRGSANRVESISSSTQTTIHPAEFLFSRTRDNPSPIEESSISQAIFSHNALRLEFLRSQVADIDNSAILVNEAGIPIVTEGGVYLLLGRALGGFTEFFIGQNADSISGIEVGQSQPKDDRFRIETTLLVRGDFKAPIEASGAVQASLRGDMVLPIEVLSLATRDNIIYVSFPSLSTIDSVPSIAESLSAIRQDFINPQEYLFSIRGDSRKPMETIGFLTRDSNLYIELVSRGTFDLSLPVEGLFSQRTDLLIPKEFLSSRNVDSKFLLENSGSALVSSDMGVPLEFPASQLLDAVNPIDALRLSISLSNQSILPIELKSSTRTDQLFSKEFIANAISFSNLNIETTRIITSDSLAYTSLLSSLNRDCIKRLEVLAGQGIDYRPTLEYINQIAIQFRDAGIPVDWYLSVTSNSVSPFYFLTSSVELTINCPAEFAGLVINTILSSMGRIGRSPGKIRIIYRVRRT